MLFSLLPTAYAEEAKNTLRRADGHLSELRLRAGHLSSLSVRRGKGLSNLPLSFVLSEGELRSIFRRVCDGSLYAFEESIKEGYLSLANGVRVGVGGRAVLRGGQIASVASITTLCFRVPHRAPHAADRLLSFFKQKRGGILLFSPPGAGKTTLLREFAREVSRGQDACRCAVIDTRGEFFGFERECLLDLLSGYPKAEGAEIAVRTLSPEVLVMDEIGEKEARALLSLTALGVPVVASAHGKTPEEIRASLLLGLTERVFDTLWSVEKNAPVAAKGGESV